MLSIVWRPLEVKMYICSFKLKGGRKYERISNIITIVLFCWWREWFISVLIMYYLIVFSQFFSCHYKIEHFSLVFHEFLVEFMRLHQSWTIKLMLDNLFFNNGLTESELIYTVDEILFRNVVTFSRLTHTLNGCNSNFLVFDNFLKTKQLIFA